MQADIAEFFEFSRWSSFDKLLGLAQRIAAKMEAAGMEEVRLIEFPADGVTAYGGWRMPRAYNVHEARLTLLDGKGSATAVLADYHLNPTSLMLYSLPTPPEGLTAELVVADTLQAMTVERVSGRLVLTSGIGLDYSQTAMRAGALGLVSDCRNVHPFFKDSPTVDQTNEWHNYTIPPWDQPNKGFGFALSPEQGRHLRRLLTAGQTLRLHAFVNTTHYAGGLPIVSGLLPGRTRDEIVLTGHYDEFGADDNCSQIAVALEAFRAVRAMLRTGEIPPLERSLRILLPMEVRGFNALIQNEAETRWLCAGLNIDTVGTDQNGVTSTCTLSDNLMALPSYTEEFAAELLTRLGEENRLFRWRRTDAEMIDNIFGEPLLGAPTPSLWHYSATHHLATDTPDRISGRMLTDMARVAATYAAFLARAGLKEALWLTELTADQGIRRLQEVASTSLRGDTETGQAATRFRRLTSLHERYRQKLGSASRLVSSLSLIPCPQILAAERQHLLGPASLLPQELFQERVSLLQSELDGVYGEAEAHMHRLSEEFGSLDLPGAEEPTPASRCVPVKAFRGFAGFEDLNEADGEYVRSVLEIESGYGAPMWLQNALMFANGKRTVGEIAALLQRHMGHGPDVARLERTFAFLAQRGMVRLRPYLTQSEVKAALEKVGLEKGALVLGHFALSRFGYIEGGAESLIDTLLSILGPEGTLVMPTFTFSWVGRLPYDPNTTASRVGAVTDRFWRRSGVLRSAHPTHSFAALGRHASALLSGHDHTRSPLSANGPLGRLADLDGKILLFAPPTSNTIMHVGEYRAGLPLLDFLCPVVVEEGDAGRPVGITNPEYGEIPNLEAEEIPNPSLPRAGFLPRKEFRHEALVPDCPWHVRFTAAYEKLYARGLVKDRALGEGVLHTMYARDAISAQAEVMRETPEALLQPGCTCLFCQRLEEQCRSNALLRQREAG